MEECAIKGGINYPNEHNAEKSMKRNSTEFQILQN